MDVYRKKWVNTNLGPDAWMAGPGAFITRSDWGMAAAFPIEDQKRIVSGMVKFDVDDIEAFEKEHKELVSNSNVVTPENKSQDTLITSLKQRLSHKHREACRQIAIKIWDEDPQKTIIYVIRSEELITACEGIKYHEKTLRRWINDLPHNRNPGRRPIKM